MNLNALKYSQSTSIGEQEYFLTVLSFDILDRTAEALVYGESDYGYQRKLNEKHYKKIASSILKSELISPTSIVLGINKSNVENIMKHVTDNIYKIDVDILLNNKSLFRIIDGQHRISGLRLANKQDPKIKDYQLSVIIMVIKDDCRRVEAQVFKDINSKAKPLKMDLAILALYKYDLLEKVKDVDIEEHVGIKVAYLLNEKNGVWKNAITLDVNSNNTIGCVGFKTFYESIKKICEIYLDRNEISQIYDGTFEEIMNFIDIKASELVNELINPCWETVRNKWEKCFVKSLVIYNFEENEIMFNKKYYIQKTMGCKAINGLISEIMQEQQGNINNTIRSFQQVIRESKLIEEDWKIGERFSGLSSEAGFKKIRNLIRNRE